MEGRDTVKAVRSSDGTIQYAFLCFYSISIKDVKKIFLAGGFNLIGPVLAVASQVLEPPETGEALQLPCLCTSSSSLLPSMLSPVSSPLCSTARSLKGTTCSEAEDQPCPQTCWPLKTTGTYTDRAGDCMVPVSPLYLVPRPEWSKQKGVRRGSSKDGKMKQGSWKRNCCWRQWVRKWEMRGREVVMGLVKGDGEKGREKESHHNCGGDALGRRCGTICHFYDQ